MGKIFGIADLPVSTIMTPFESVYNFQPPLQDDLDYVRKSPFGKYEQQADSFISKTVVKKSNPFIKMRNGFGKLMKHFSKKI